MVELTAVSYEHERVRTGEHQSVLGRQEIVKVPVCDPSKCLRE